MKYTHPLLAATLLLVVLPFVSLASHLAGGEFVYKYLGDSAKGALHFSIYEVSLYIYQDCKDGVETAIQQDDPAFFTIYSNDGNRYPVDSMVFYNRDPASGAAIALPAEIETICGKISVEAASICMLRKRFTKRYALPVNTSGYTIAYQRCCRNGNLSNIQNAGDKGSTFFCVIPPANTLTNNSAQFTGHPPQIICIHSTNIIDQAATDADGDSLTYALDDLYDGASGPDIKPKIATPPPYNKMNDYAPGYAATQPLGPNGEVTIDEKTGLLTVRATTIGKQQLAIKCNEWRNGNIINTMHRELTWTVTDCAAISKYKPHAGSNRTVVAGDTLHFYATNAVNYKWQPATFLNNPMVADPVGTFPTPGEYTYILYGENSKGCSGTDTVKVRVQEHTEYTAPTAFTPNGDGVNDALKPIPVGKTVFKSMRVYNRWGNVIYSTTNEYFGWNGTYNNKPQDMGTYVWQIEYTDSFGQPRVASGSTVLIR